MSIGWKPDPAGLAVSVPDGLAEAEGIAVPISIGEPVGVVTAIWKGDAVGPNELPKAREPASEAPGVPAESPPRASRAKPPIANRNATAAAVAATRRLARVAVIGSILRTARGSSTLPNRRHPVQRGIHRPLHGPSVSTTRVAAARHSGSETSWAAIRWRASDSSIPRPVRRAS